MAFKRNKIVRTKKTSETHRSGFETTVINESRSSGFDVAYEIGKIQYIIPEKLSTYTPDVIFPRPESMQEVFANPKKFLIIEIKGRFVAKDRMKHSLVKKQHPELDIRFVFQRPYMTLDKGSKTTYAQWCEKNNIKWAHNFIPKEWLEEYLEK